MLVTWSSVTRVFSHGFVQSFQLPLREVECLPPGQTVKNPSRVVSTPDILSPYSCFPFSVLLHRMAFGFTASDLFTDWRRGGWGWEGEPPFRTSKSAKLVPLVGSLEEPALSAYQQSQALSREVGVRWGLGAGLGSDCPEWKQTPTPNQTQIEIPGGTGCPKISQAMLGQGGRGQTMNSSSSPRGVRFPGLC